MNDNLKTSINIIKVFFLKFTFVSLLNTFNKSPLCQASLNDIFPGFPTKNKKRISRVIDLPFLNNKNSYKTIVLHKG